MVVGGSILFVDLKVRDYATHVVVGRYIAVIKEANMKLAPRGGQN